MSVDAKPMSAKRRAELDRAFAKSRAKLDASLARYRNAVPDSGVALPPRPRFRDHHGGPTLVLSVRPKRSSRKRK